MNRFRQLSGNGLVALQVAGLVAVVAGVSAIYWPAGLIVGGAGVYLIGEAA